MLRRAGVDRARQYRHAAIYGINSLETAEAISKRIGDQTIGITSLGDNRGSSYSYSPNGQGSGQHSWNSGSNSTFSETARRLLKKTKSYVFPTTCAWCSTRTFRSSWPSGLSITPTAPSAGGLCCRTFGCGRGRGRGRGHAGADPGCPALRGNPDRAGRSAASPSPRPHPFAVSQARSPGHGYTAQAALPRACP